MLPGHLELLVVADSFGGGLGASARAHARWFAARGWQVALAAPAAEDGPISPAHAIALPVPESAFDVAAMASTARRLRVLLRTRRPAIVHAHGTRSQLLTLLAGRRPLVTMHGAGRVEGQGAIATGARHVARRLAPMLSEGAYSAAPASGRWQTLLHASPALAGLEALQQPSTTPPTFLWIGRLDEPKRPDVFVRACALAAAVQPLRGVMVGGGPLIDQVQELVHAEAAPVDVVGEVRDVAPYLREARAVCLFSSFEGVPFAVQEAMWVGLPVVLSPLPSLRWFAGDAAAYALQPQDAASEMLRLCDPGLACARGRAAAQRIRELLSPDDPYPRLMKLYADARR